MILGLLLLAAVKFQVMTEGDLTLVLLENEAVLSGVTVNEGAVVEVSGDALSWRTPAQKWSNGAVRFPASAVRAIRIKGAVGNFELIEADQGKLAVSDVTVSEITEGSAVVRWKTSFPLKTALLYGYREGDMKSLNPSLEVGTDHEARLSGLYPGIEYKIWILADTEGFGDRNGDPFRFKTKGTPLPFAHDPVVSVGIDTASFIFTSNIPVKAWIEFRDGKQVHSGNTAPSLRHRIALSGLSPRTTREYQIVTADGLGRTTATPWMEFRTCANNVAIGAPVSGTFVRLLQDQTAGSDALDRITDGRLDYFEGMATSQDPGETDQWVEVDLGVERELESIETIWRGNAYPNGFYILASCDREQWSYPGFDLDAATGAAERSERGDPLRRVAVAVPRGEKIRYIKIFVPRGSAYFVRSGDWKFVQLAEVEAHGVWEQGR